MSELHPDDQILQALNAVTETLAGDRHQQPAAMAQNGPHSGNPDMSGNSAGGNGNDEQSETPPKTGSSGGGNTPRPPVPPGGNVAPGEGPEDPDPGIWLALPDGRAVNTNELLRRSRETGEATISAGVLKSGDFVVFKAPPDEDSDSDRGAVFEVSGVEWVNIAPGALPQAKVTGRLRSTDLPAETTDDELEFVGSGFGGTAVQNNVLATDMPPYFEKPDRQSVVLDGYRFVETFRATDEGINSLGPNELDRQAQVENAQHTGCLEQLTSLGDAIGVDMRQRHITEPIVLRQDGEAGASYNADRYSGNVLTTLEREGRTWAQARYVNDDNRDLLQISIADMSNVNLGRTFAFGIHEAAQVNASQAPLLTYTTSNRSGIKSIQLRPGLEDTIQQLRMPVHPGGQTYTPSVNISPDGQVSIDTSGPAGVVLREHPGLAERMAAAIHVEATPEGELIISLASKRYTLPSPESILQRMAGVIQGGNQ